MNELIYRIHNGESVGLEKVPLLNMNAFRRTVIDKINNGSRICSFFSQAVKNSDYKLFAVIAGNNTGDLEIISTSVSKSYYSLTPECPQLHLFEREILENTGIYPKGHPWLKAVRSKTMNNHTENTANQESELVTTDSFFKVRGAQIHEVAVGPVHAGIIEPGHFRFQCEGEEVLHLEIALGYQHRGIEKALVGGPDKRTIRLMETVAGDTTIGHNLAYCQLYESLSNTKVPVRSEYIRAIALELERLANHTGDLGAIAGDVGYLPTSAYCGRIRGDFLNMTALICGSRFGRTLLKPGGVNYDIDSNMAKELRKRLLTAHTDVKQATELLWNSISVMNRLNETGRLEIETAKELGMVGMSARACGIERDVRFEFPTGIFKYLQIPISTWSTGDVFARAYVRWLEINRSVRFINDLLENLPAGDIINEEKNVLQPDRLAVSLTEGWRGEICHTAITGNDGKFLLYKVVDPSFHNWAGVAIALRNQQISDFPLCNKSFNLSYCGFDL